MGSSKSLEVEASKVKTVWVVPCVGVMEKSAIGLVFGSGRQAATNTAKIMERVIRLKLMEHLFFIYPDLMVKKQRYGKCTRRTGPP
jgi:hypothetical protein